MALRIGLVTPVVHINPRFDPPDWETTGTAEDVVYVAQEAERLGYDWVAASEHIAIPGDATGVRGPRYWDPVATLSYVAAHTTRISLLSHVVVLSYHHPLEIVKRWGTVDVPGAVFRELIRPFHHFLHAERAPAAEDCPF